MSTSQSGGVNDSNEVSGIAVTNRLISQVQDIANKCQPAITIDFEKVDAVNNVLVVNVPEGKDKPYGCRSGYYVRVGPNSQKMTRAEITEFLRVEGKIRFDELENLTFDY